MVKYQIFILISFLFLAIPGRALSKSKSDLADPTAMEVYHSFWQTFEKRQKELIRDGQKKYESSWNNLSQDHFKQKFDINQEIIDKLKESASDYRDQLHTSENAENRPYVLLNLAQVLYLLSENINQEENNSTLTGYQEEAINLLNEIRDNFPLFLKWDYALFLQANIYSTLGQKQKSFRSWKILASKTHQSIYHVYAHTAIGDHYFYQENPHRAVINYEKALALLRHLKISEQNQKILMLEYRLAWAAYRSGSLYKVINTGINILSPNRHLGRLNEQNKLNNDIVELLGDVLFEIGETEKIEKYLNYKSFGNHAPKVGSYLAERYLNSRQFFRLEATLNHILKMFPLSSELPHQLSMLAAAYKTNNQTKLHIKNLEQLALLLPEKSLWRSKHSGDLSTMKRMEKLAFQAALLLAKWHFNTGVSSGLSKHYMSAASFFSIVLDFSPYHKDASRWRLSKAHCYFYSENFEEAAMQYSQLLSDIKLDKELLQISSYQLAISYEKMWRRSFREALESGMQVTNDEKTIGYLVQLEKAVNSYVSNFPSSSKAIDLLLVAATANKDQGRYQLAITFWNKVLNLGSTIGQRSKALRGIVFATLKHRSTGNLIVALRKFLRLEDWKALGSTMQREFLSLLGQASLDEGLRLHDNGAITEAGQLLVSIASEFHGLPQRSRIMRDGAYYLAIAGNWLKAQEAGLNYLSWGLKKEKADMLYLLARSYEYQLKFMLASDYYWQLASGFPRHKKTPTSLLRSEKLAEADDLFELAGNASELLGKYEKSHQKKMSCYKRSVSHFLKAKKYRKAIKVAKLRLKLSKDLLEKFETKILLAKTYLSGYDISKGINIIKGVIQSSKNSKSKIGAEPWASIYGEANIILANEISKEFKTVELWNNLKRFNYLLSIKKKSYQRLKNIYLAAIRSNHLEWSAMGRYKLGDISESFSIELSSSLFKLEQSGQRPSATLINEASDLRFFANKLFSQNVLLSSKQNYASNSWVNKSKWRIRGTTIAPKKPFEESVIPHAVHLDLPYQWSL
ncbi:MAG: hypothetical protein AB8G05_14660 [Oligoflexales bacterium]